MTPVNDEAPLPIAGVTVPADRRFRRSALRPDRRRIGRRLVRVAGWAVAGLVLAAVAGWTFERVLRADALRVRHIAVHGNARLPAGEIAALVEGLHGENIFEVDFAAYRRRLLDSPWVGDATFRRALPSTIEIQIVERTPLAIARLGQQLYLVDEAGVIIDEYGATYADLDLPIVDGLLASPSAQGPLTDPGRIQLVRGLIAALAARPELLPRLSQVNLASARDVVVMFDTYPVWLHLGDTRFVERLQAFFELVPTLNERFAEIDEVDLRFDDRVFIRPRGRRERRATPDRRGDETVQRPSRGQRSEEAHGA